MKNQLISSGFDPQSWIRDELTKLKKKSLFRCLKVTEPLAKGKLRYKNRELLNLCSNNYLGLSEELSFFSLPFPKGIPIGSTASRLITGNHPSFKELETTMATLMGTESCLIATCGYMANLGVISSLVGRKAAVFSDRFNHASIVDGIQLSGARHFRFHHNDPEHLAFLLEKQKGIPKKLIITESLFSMDGDLALLKQYVNLKEKYQTMLMVDEAHSCGIYGKKGAGLVNELNLGESVDILMGTFGKAYGSFGAFIAGSRNLIRFLINKAKSFIYSTGLPPAVNDLNLKSVNLSMQAEERRAKLFSNATFFRDGLKKIGCNIGSTTSHIIPLILGDEQKVLNFSQDLWDRGIAAIAIRPPTVPKGTARIRFSISSTHEQPDLKKALKAIQELTTTLSQS